MRTVQLLAWGANSHGQLGLGHKCEQVLEPARVDTALAAFQAEDIVAVGGGAGHSVVLVKNGTLYSCGLNSKGQLGLGGTSDTAEFKSIESLANQRIIQFSCGWDFTAAVTDAGQIYVWGSNLFEQLSLPKTTRYVAEPTLLQIADVKYVSCGIRHMIILTKGRKIYSCGSNSKGQLGIGAPAGRSLQSLQSVPGFDDDSISVSCGQAHSIVFGEGGNLSGWGDNKWGQLSFNPQKTVITTPQRMNIDIMTAPAAICTGWSHTVMLTQDGSVINFGRNTYSQLGDGREQPWVPAKLEIDEIIQISVGSEHNLAINKNDELLSWGWNEHGSCGNGSVSDVTRPTKILLGAKVTLVAAGTGQSFCIAQPN